MATVKDYGRLVLGAIIPARTDLLLVALDELSPEHFSDPVQSNFFRILQAVHQRTNGVLTRISLTGKLERSSADAGRKALYLETFDDYFNLKVEDADFLWAVHELREIAAETAMKTALEQSMKILTTGVTEKDDTVLRGQEAARDYLLDALADIDTTLAKQESPHGNIKEEGDIIVSEYLQSKKERAAGNSPGINFGISELDQKVGGLQPGDLSLAVGYSSDGKTSLCVQLAWSAMVEQGKNVLFLTTETVNTVVRRKLIARHSKFQKFQEFQFPEGLNSRALKEGTLSDREEEFFRYLVNDFTSSEEYGSVYIYQVPRGATMDEVERIAYRVQKEFPIDLIVLDYLALLRPVGHRSTDRESLSGIIKNGKQFSTTFNKGAGVSLISPWQVSRAHRERAESVGQYSLASLAETAEATNSADLIISLLAPTDNTNRYAEISMQVLKHRDGETASGIQVEVDYATSTFRSKLALSGFSTTPFGGAPSSGFDSLLD